MKSYLTIAVLIVVGEIIFSLPFHITRFFRPTFLEVFNLSNTELGDIFAAYGLVAVGSYFFGGIVADRFSVRVLLMTSLITTSLGGLYLAQIPSHNELVYLFAYWGLTTIFLFWSALIKATREWGGNFSQGKAFGLLDAGRGIVAAGAASIAVVVFKFYLSQEIENPSFEDQVAAITAVIYLYSMLTILAAILVFLFLPTYNNHVNMPLHDYKQSIYRLLSKRVLWLQAIIVLCAYCGFKGIDNYGLYAVEVLNFNELQSAQFVSLLAYLRPIIAIVIGVLADRFMSSRLIMLMFCCLLISYILLVFLSQYLIHINLLYINIIATTAFVFGLRAIYFALFQEFKASKSTMGMSVGIVSIVGFMPDVFFAPLAGRILDMQGGFEYYFILLALFAICGIFASLYLRRLIYNNKQVT